MKHASHIALNHDQTVVTSWVRHYLKMFYPSAYFWFLPNYRVSSRGRERTGGRGTPGSDLASEEAVPFSREAMLPGCCSRTAEVEG